MKLYNSFLLRCWVIRGTVPEEFPSQLIVPPVEKMVFDIEHIQNGEHLRAASPHEAIEWIVAVCEQHNETAGVASAVQTEEESDHEV